MQMLMESTPTEIDHNFLYKTLSEIKYVHNVHDLHVWSLSDGKMAMTVHLVVLTKNSEKNQRVLNRCDDVLRSAFRLNHFSIQIESEKYKCGNDLHDWLV
jgi:Co/Zn/Cd efflux system component